MYFSLKVYYSKIKKGKCILIIKLIIPKWKEKRIRHIQEAESC